MINGCFKIKKKFATRKGIFNQKYLSIRTSHFELTIDDLVYPNRNGHKRFLVCLCTPYREGIDKRKKKQGFGAGEVKESWLFDSEYDALEFIGRTNLV